MKVAVDIKVNGDIYSREVKPGKSLLEFLREDLGLTGTNCGCNKGDCGACTVLLNGKSVNSCLVLAAECDGAEVLTIEGFSAPGELHPVQEAFIEEGAVQCGFCTPGMVIRAVEFLEGNRNPTEEEARVAIEGNICRCTGYERIVSAVLSAAEKIRNKGK